MKAQESWSLYEGASHLGSHGGTLRVEAGQVWLTRSGDPDDHFLRAGDLIRVPPGDILVEAWDAAGTPARIVWEPLGLLERWRSLLHNAGHPRRPDGRSQAGERPRLVAEKARRGAAGAA